MSLNRPRRSRSRRSNYLALSALCLLLPSLMGGCPEFQDATVDVFENAARGLLDAALDLFFDQYRTDASK